MTKDVLGITKGIKKLKLTPYHKRRCKCPACGRQVIAHKLARHQRRAHCKLAQLQRRLHGFDSHD